MYERFTERARQVMILAQDEAKNRSDYFIGTEHILLGLLREEDGLAAKILESLKVTADKVHESISARSSRSEPVPPRPEKEKKFPLTSRTKHALELALREALSLGHNYIGTEHILLGLIRDDNLALEILQDDFSLPAEKIRDEVIRMLSGPKAPIRVKGPESKPQGSEYLTNGTALYSPDELTRIVSVAIDLARKYPDRSGDAILKAAKSLA